MLLKKNNYKSVCLHGDMNQSSRTNSLKEFKSKSANILVASDVAARGIDVKDLSHVFNYDVPNNPEDYVHRIGRTGRAGKKGKAYTIFNEKDEKNVLLIEKLIKKKVKKLNIKDINLSNEIGADCVEIHTGHFSNLIKAKKSFIKEFLKIKKCAILASKIGVEAHAGHGLDYKSTKILTKINEIVEFNIGHFIIGESIFYGLPFVIKKFKRIIKNKK